MHSLQKKLLANDMDFQTCGEIMVAAKYNTYAMSCNYCQQKFTQIQTFMRHLQLLHTDKVEFAEKDKDVEVYAVEELITSTQTTTVEDSESEESGLADVDDGHWLTEEDKKWLDDGDGEIDKYNKKSKGLANMSILKAFEDCDVSLNFVNLNNTRCYENEEEEKGKEEGEKEGEEENYGNEEDSILNNTLLQEIQHNWNAKEKSENVTTAIDDLEGDVTMTEEIEKTENLRSKSDALKGLLEGLEDLEDVDSILNNLEDSVIENPIKNIKTKIINLQGITEESIKSDYILETTTMEDLDITLKVNEQDSEENVVNFKLTKKKANNELPKVCKNSIKTQHKMVLNMQSGEFEELETDNQQEDSLEEENLIFNNFLNKIEKQKSIADNFQESDLNLENSILKDSKLQLNKEEKSKKEENLILNNFLNKIPEEISKDSNISQKSKELRENLESEEFYIQLRNLEESLQDDPTTSHFVKKTSKNSDNSKENPLKLSANESNNRESFDLQLKMLEDSLNEENCGLFNNSAKIVKDTKISQNFDKFSKMRRNNLLKEFDLELSETEEDTLAEESKEMAGKEEIRHMENFDQTDDQSCDNNFEYSQNIEKITDNCEESKKYSSISFNDDLTKALTDALEGDHLNLFNFGGEEERDPPLNQHLKDLLTQELMEEESIDKIKETANTNKINKKKEIKPSEPLTKPKKSLNSPSCSLKSHYVKTNISAKNKQNLTKRNLTLKNANSNHLKQYNENSESKILTPQNAQILNNAQKRNKSNQNAVKCNNEMLSNHFQNKSFSQNAFKSQTCKISKENEENLYINPKLPKTPKKDIQEKIFLNPRPHKTPKKEKDNLTPDFIKKIKLEKFTPVQSFINTERGDRTPLKRDEIFLKQSPKTQEKNENSLENFTPIKGETTPKTKEQIFLKQSPKTQEKHEINQTKTPKTNEKTPKTREQISLKQSPKTQEKNGCLAFKNIQKTPGKLDLKFNIIESKRSPQKQSKIQCVNTTKQIFTSPIKSSKRSAAVTPLLTPQRTKNLAIKLPRLTPDKLKQIQKYPTFTNTKSTESKSPITPQSQESKKSPLQTENKTNWNNFKLPSGITISKVSPNNNKQTSNTENKKQNFPETYTNLDLLINKDLPDLKLSLIKPLKLPDTSIKQRQRKASIDIIPNQLLTSHYQPSLPLPKTTPKHSNLDYKSYAVNRSARKREVLQRMRNIKKQIFRSIENGREVTKITRALKSPLNKQKKKRIQIENVQILPKLRQEVMTPLVNQFDNFKRPCNSNVNSTPPAISPKNLNDDEKQAKISLKIPNNTSPINDDEKLIKKSLKRPATSPIQGDGKQAKRLHKSASELNNQDVIDLSESETTQLDLSESVVNFLQHDLKVNRLNVDSFLNEDLPIDDNTPNETSIDSNGKKETNNTSADNVNILDDLLTQVNMEQQHDDKYQHKKEVAKETTKAQNLVIDFDETRDINLLNKFGLKILKITDIEDVMPFEEVEEMQGKAKKFAEIYRYYQRIWCSKNGESPNLRQELDISFKQFLNQTNQIFNLELSMIDIRRLVNLITLWYSQNFNSKLIEKKNISEATNCYLSMFHFIPKTAKRFYYCEFCGEFFTTEHKYFTHRIVHTGAQYPYKCAKCSLGFRILKTSKTHEQQCSIQSKNTSIKPLAKNSAGHLKCPVCSEIFETSKLLYDHSKTHLKTVYNCFKCELVFASASDVQKHMTLCNRNIKRIPKQSTPRPTKSRVEN